MPAMNVSSKTSVKGTRAASRSLMLGGGNEYLYGETEPRVSATFRCTKGHEAHHEFHYQAELPQRWTCAQCGTFAARVDPPLREEQGANLVIPDDHQPVRPNSWYTGKHRREVFTRRTPEELEEVLAERLAIYRLTQPQPEHAAEEGAA